MKPILGLLIMENLYFELIETILWENGGYFLLDLHLRRMEKSAEYLDFSFDKGNIEEALRKEAVTFEPENKYKLRLLLKFTGTINISSKILDEPQNYPVKITVSKKKTHDNDIFLYHKTTNRDLYEKEYAKYNSRGFFDVLFFNQDDELTEGAITNVIIEDGTGLYTPPVSCGLLAGVYREHLLGSGELNLKEKVLYMEDLLNARKIFLINSVRKMIETVVEI